MHKIGLHGKSFIPLLIGFGCSVPAIMATRILESRRDRMTTIMLIPLMSCAGRFPIYALFIPAFFVKKWQAPVLWFVYIFGVLMAVLVAVVLRKTLFRGESEPLVMELPPYRVPTLKGSMAHVWNRGWLYIKKAGTVILAGSIILWFLSSFPRSSEDAAPEVGPSPIAALEGAKDGADENLESAEALAQSYAGRLGKLIEPSLRVFGADWRIGIGVLGGIAAKELFVAQMGVVFALGSEEAAIPSLQRKLTENYSPLAGLAIILFCLIGTPCVATLAATARETGSWKWAVGQLFGLTVLAWIVAVAVYQTGKLLGWGL
jgi:ferrous iron transport protein B